ncbi:hypothetical protein [Bifidobacterium sp. ESL0732]|uniref:hypothetical protein n=1 Tax=Bifidobacterium sp. ESL0732 TaxID=2983222 RepID=UPI0023F98B05|nr:hypothetical protein [Bifidobacterium sp. ESL0732]WEV63777.1 hypothetical protein OZX70_07535 [Bifidobacterium sp. ESL0732]
MQDEDELYRMFGITAEQVEKWSEEADNDTLLDDGGWGPWIKIRDLTPEEQDSLDRAIVLRDRIDALKEETGMSELEAEIKMEAIVKAEEAAKSQAESEKAVASR